MNRGRSSVEEEEVGTVDRHPKSDRTHYYDRTGDCLSSSAYVL